jgi:hypothetical protein
MLWFFIFLLSCISQSPHSLSALHSLNRRMFELDGLNMAKEAGETGSLGRGALKKGPQIPPLAQTKNVRFQKDNPREHNYDTPVIK